jgi:hypothetical protein
MSVVQTERARVTEEDLMDADESGVEISMSLWMNVWGTLLLHMYV